MLTSFWRNVETGLLVVNSGCGNGRFAVDFAGGRIAAGNGRALLLAAANRHLAAADARNPQSAIRNPQSF